MEAIIKLPFKDYTALNCDIINTLDCIDVYRLFVLSLTTDKITNTTNTTFKQLAALCNESERSYYENNKQIKFTERIKDFIIITYYRDNQNSDEINLQRIKYTFPPVSNQYRLIKKELQSMDISNKLKGYLIKLYSISNTNNLTIGYSKVDIHNLIGVSRPTQNKYNTELIEKGLLEQSNGELIIKCDCMTMIHTKEIATKETIEIIKSQLQIIKGYLHMYNLKNKNNQILKLDAKSLKILLNNGLSSLAYAIGIYYLNKFQNVYNINSLVKKLVENNWNKKSDKNNSVSSDNKFTDKNKMFKIV